MKLICAFAYPFGNPEVLLSAASDGVLYLNPFAHLVAYDGRDYFRAARSIYFNYYYYSLDWRLPYPQNATPSWQSLAIPSKDEIMVTISSESFIEKCRSLAKSRDLHLEVVDRRIRLSWIRSSDGKVDFMERVDAIGLGISYDMLLEAVMDAGGSIDTEGRYPINNAIRYRIRALM